VKKLSTHALQGAFWNVLIRNTLFVITFIGNIFLIRMLVPGDYGTFALILSIVDIIFIIGSLGISNACVYYHDDDPDVFETGMVLSWVLALILVCASFIAVIILNLFSLYSGLVLLLILLTSIVNSLNIPTSVYLANIECNLDFKKSALLTFVGPILGLLVGLWLANNEFGIWALFYKNSLAVLLTFVIVFFISKSSIKFSYSKYISKKILRYGLGIFYQRVSEIFSIRLPMFLLSFLAGVTVLGLYERSRYLAQLQNTVLDTVFGKVAFTIYSKVKNNSKAVTKGCQLTLLFVSRLSFLSALLVFYYSDFIIALLFGNEWKESSGFLQGFSLLIISSSLYGPMLYTAMSRGILKSVTVVTIVMGFINICGLTIIWLTGLDWSLFSWVPGLSITIGCMWLSLILLHNGIKLNWVPIIFHSFMLVAVSIFVKELSAVYYSETIQILLILIVWSLLTFAINRNEISYLYERIKK
jgi:O-antigen/teichoic acid export membrane protein